MLQYLYARLALRNTPTANLGHYQGLLSGATFVKFATGGLFISCQSVGRNGKQQKNHDGFLLLMMHKMN